MKRVAVLLIAVAGAPVVSVAQAPALHPPPLIEEFFLARRVTVEEKGDLEVSMGAERRTGAIWKSAADFEYGLTDSLQIQAEVPVRRAAGGEGESDSSVGFMYSLRSSTTQSSLSAGLRVALGRSPRQDITGTASRFEPFIAAGRSFGPVVLQADAVYGERRLRPFVWNAAAVYPWRNWRGVFELNHGESDVPGSYVVTSGIVWKGPYRMEVGLGVPISIRSNERSRGVTLKLTREFDVR